ncbi:MAG: diguanylate cyclase [Acidobacteriota bacterium]|nr:diguanylate cyclase [Acidobacteriota bacterium]
MTQMPVKAKIYIGFTLVAGAALLGGASFHWQCNDPARFLAYFFLALMASGLKISLPGMFGTMSLNFLFVLIGLLELSFSETLTMGCAATLVQCFYHAKFRPTLLHASFSVASVAVAIGSSALVHAHTIRDTPGTHLLLAGLVACTYFVTNTISVAAVIALTERKSVRKVWLECYFWCFPYYLLGASIAWLLSLAGRFIGWQASLLAIPIIYFIYRSYRSYLGRLDDQTRHVDTVAALHMRTIEALALAIEAKDVTTHDHLRRVSVYAVEIGKSCGLDEVALNALHAAALLHDIGKLAVPENIISKPGKLKPEEFEKMKIHPVVGAEILDRVQFPYPVVPIVRSHHEKWDGTGYPAGLKGEEIPLGARILSVVDCLDALASDRQYRNALPLHEAMEKVVSESGRSFDPKIVAMLQSRYVELEQMAKSQPIPPSRLSKGLKILNGAAPAAGFETAGPGDFITSIATATREAQAMFELTENLGTSLSLEETLPVIARTVKRMVPYDAFAVFLLKERILHPEFVDGPSSRLVASLEIPIGAGVSGWVAENNTPIINGNPTVEPGYAPCPGGGNILRSALAVPLPGANGAIGVVAVYNSEKDAFTKEHLRLLSEVSAKAVLSVENALKYREAASSATTDYLTDLPNARSLFVHLQTELDRCKRLNLPLAVLVCDLDGFKQVNDRFGHLEGNKVLWGIAKGLKENCRENDYVARMGGDEFVVVLPGTSPGQISIKAHQITRIAVQAGRELLGEDILSISVGEASYPECGSSPEELLAEADRQMFRAKRRYRKSQPWLRVSAGARPMMMPPSPATWTH